MGPSTNPEGRRAWPCATVIWGVQPLDREGQVPVSEPASTVPAVAAVGASWRHSPRNHGGLAFECP